MRVTRVSSQESVYNTTDVEVIKTNLEKLASQHNTTVDVLLEGARAAGSAGAPYQIRALNLEARIKRLEG